MRIVNQAGGEELASRLKFRRTTGQVLELSTNLDHVAEKSIQSCVGLAVTRTVSILMIS